MPTKGGHIRGDGCGWKASRGFKPPENVLNSGLETHKISNGSKKR
jgi:hypothetical protein